VFLYTSLRRILAQTVGPLEHASAVDDCVNRIYQEHQLLHPDLQRGVGLDFLTQLLFAFDSELAGLFVIVEPVYLVHILVVVLLGPLLLVARVFFLVEFVAVVVVLVVGPGLEAHPAEVEATAARALAALHVVAALILLDVLVALRTGLRVDHNPIDVLPLRVVFVHPLFGRITRGRFVGFLQAMEAEGVVAHTLDEIVGVESVQLHNLPAIIRALGLVLLHLHKSFFDELSLFVKFHFVYILLPV